jgi:hypothetical protein
VFLSQGPQTLLQILFFFVSLCLCVSYSRTSNSVADIILLCISVPLCFLLKDLKLYCRYYSSLYLCAFVFPTPGPQTLLQILFFFVSLCLCVSYSRTSNSIAFSAHAVDGGYFVTAIAASRTIFKATRVFGNGSQEPSISIDAIGDDSVG